MAPAQMSLERSIDDLIRSLFVLLLQALQLRTRGQSLARWRCSLHLAYRLTERSCLGRVQLPQRGTVHAGVLPLLRGVVLRLRHAALLRPRREYVLRGLRVLVFRLLVDRAPLRPRAAGLVSLPDGALLPAPAFAQLLQPGDDFLLPRVVVLPPRRGAAPVRRRAAALLPQRAGWLLPRPGVVPFLLRGVASRLRRATPP